MVDIFDTLTNESMFGLDIAFVIDSTGSMISYINGAKHSIKEIMNQSQIRFKKYKADESMLRFGIVAYRDHPPQESSWVTKLQDFTDFSTAHNFLENLSASGGGDPPEAVLDGLDEAVNKLTWNENTEKILFLLLDNPGHGIRWGTSYDCPCKLHEKDILIKMKKMQINFHILRPNEENKNLDKMIDCFKEYVELETMALEKYKKIYVNIVDKERAMDSDTEMRIFSRVKYRNLHKNSSETKKYNSRNNSKDSRELKENGANKHASNKLRERSRSRSIEKRKMMEVEIAPDKEKEKKEKTLESAHSKLKEYMNIDDENTLEKGIRDIIANTVILKLDQQLKSFSNNNK